MLVSLSWLQKYVRLPDDTAQLVEDLTMTGLNVENVTSLGFDDPKVVVGAVLDVGKHPDADKLTVCRVDAGDGAERQIVCGAPNVAAGQRVLVALPGAKLPGDFKIRKSKIRGQKSEGMICSAKELGIGEDAAGILVLDGDPAPGTPMREVTGTSDTALEIEVTPNRPDLLSHVGIAREVGAIYEVPLTLPYDPNPKDASGRADFSIKIENADDCARYVGARIDGVKVGPSPAWLRSALESIGLHSVNNIVDVTNYVLFELGQPIHAFDYDKLGGARIGVRRAEKGERLLALDGETHELDTDTLLITEGRDPVALAGIIGGEETAVHEETTRILIEAANFHPQVVRRARKRLGISTDASYRFERGVDPELPPVAARRAVELIGEVAGGSPGPIVDLYPAPHQPATVTLRSASARRIIGTGIGAPEMENLLARIGFVALQANDDAVSVQVPAWRPDIVEEADLIEEVARLHGYNSIGAGWNYRCTTVAQIDPLEQFIDTLADQAAASGFFEVVSSSFTDGQELEDFGWPKQDPRTRLIPLRNPLNENHRFLRTSLLPGMLDIVRHNISRGERRVQIYQIGRVFVPTEDHDQLPDERTLLTMVMTHPEGTDFWYHGRKSLELYDIKGEVERLLRTARIDLGGDLHYTFDEVTGDFGYSLGQDVLIEGGIVSDAVGLRYDLEQPVWHVTMDLMALYDRLFKKVNYRPLVEFPVTKRDLSLVAASDTRFEVIEKSLVKSAGRLLESLQVFDVYSGDHIVSGHTAYGVRLTFRSAERTLTDAEVDVIIEKILTKLKNQHGVELRS